MKGNMNIDEAYIQIDDKVYFPKKVNDYYSILTEGRRKMVVEEWIHICLPSPDDVYIFDISEEIGSKIMIQQIILKK